MSLDDDLAKAVREVFQNTWSTRQGTKVPESGNVGLGNEAVEFDGTVLYADLDASTNLVDSQKPTLAAEIYKTYLNCAAKIIRSKGGVITSYDGDRIMAVYIGNSKTSAAAESALKINYAVAKIINPILKERYPNMKYVVKQIVGIDTSKLFVARTGIRGSNDLVWVGRAANYAAKLCSLSADYPSRLTEAVYNQLDKSAKYSSDEEPMWKEATWKDMNGMKIYRSTWMWKV